MGLPGAGTARPITGGQLRGAALSPDGSRLAVAVTEGSALQMLLRVIPLAPGVRGGTWVLPGSLAACSGCSTSLSWTADNRVLSIPVRKELIFLDTTKPSGQMLAASRVIPFDGYSGKATTGITYACFPETMVMSLDGTTLTCGGSPSTDYGRQDPGGRRRHHLNADRGAAGIHADAALQRVGERALRAAVLGQPDWRPHLRRHPGVLRHPAATPPGTQDARQPHRLAGRQGGRVHPGASRYRRGLRRRPGRELRGLVIQPAPFKRMPLHVHSHLHVA
jgi:hypothetical protein